MVLIGFLEIILQIQHPRSQLSRFDLVITPRHDYYPLTPHAQEQIPWFLRRWITPREPPGRHVVCTLVLVFLFTWIHHNREPVFTFNNRCWL